MERSGRRGIFVGLTTVDIVLRVERPPRGNEKTVASQRLLLAGGPAANAAIAFARLGGAATLVTEIGRSPLGELARADLAREGVEIVDFAPAEREPTLAVVLSDAAEGGRTVVLSRAPKGETDSAAALAVWLAELSSDGAAIALSDGHLPHLSGPILRAARARGWPTVLDAGSWKPALTELAPLTDYAIASADFDPSGRALERLQELGARHVAVSAGAGPIQWRTSDGASGAEPVPQIEAVDTLGAGDVLHGAFAWQVLQGLSFSAALRAAARAASESCQHFGRAPRAS